MNTSISDFFKQTGTFFKKQKKETKIVMLVSAFVILAVLAICFSVFNSADYTPLYSGLSSKEGGDIIAQLDKMGISYQTKSGGTVLVPAEDLAKVKMQLAAEGFPKSTLSYDLFLNRSDLLSTDYEKKQLLRFQLQERLQESIKTIQGVNNAIVTLSIPEDNSYVLKNEKIETTASVILDLDAFTKLSVKQVNGIELLVANSVPDLFPENVVIIDSNGQRQNGAEDISTGADLKIETVNIINHIFEDKIRTFLEPIFGKGDISVSVNVLVDFKTVLSEETVYTPVVGDNGVISWVERTFDGKKETETGLEGEIPTYEESVPVSEDGAYIDVKESYSAQYLVNQLIRQIQDNGGNITDMTVAAAINRKELSPEERSDYQELIAYSAGISPEKVMLVNAEFFKAPSPGEDTVPDKETKTPFLALYLTAGQKIVILCVFGLLLVGLVVLLGILAKNRKRRLKRLQEEAARRAMAEAEAKAEAKIKENMPGEIVLNETREQALKRQVKEFAAGHAETVASLLRVWIKEED